MCFSLIIYLLTLIKTMFPLTVIIIVVITHCHSLLMLRLLSLLLLLLQGTRLAAVIEQARSGDVFEAPVEMGHKVMKFVQGFMGGGK